MNYYLIIILVFILCFVWYVRDFIKKKRRLKEEKLFKENVIHSKDINLLDYKDVSQDVFERYAVDNVNAFKSSLYEIFLFFEYAYNNFNLDRMKLFCTNEVYNLYQTNIDLCIRTGRKKVIEKMTRNRNPIIFDIQSDSNSLVVKTIIDINYVFYTLNKMGMVVSGSKNLVNEKFEVVFIKKFNEEATNCPNCGAPLKEKSCEFCSTVVLDAVFRICSIKRIV